MYADDPTSLFDSTQKLLLFSFCEWLVNWVSTDPHSAPCNFNMLQSWARRLAVRENGMVVYLLLALKSSFPLMSVFSSVKDQGPVQANGVGSYLMKIPKTMDRENVLFWIGQRWLIRVTQEGCSGLSHLWRRVLMRKTQQGFIATLYRPPHASSLYGVGGLWIQRLGMQKCANSEVGRLMISYLPQVGFIHRELMHWTLLQKDWSMFEIDQYVFDLWSHMNIGNSTFTLIVYVLSMFK